MHFRIPEMLLRRKYDSIVLQPSNHLNFSALNDYGADPTPCLVLIYSSFSSHISTISNSAPFNISIYINLITTNYNKIKFFILQFSQNKAGKSSFFYKQWVLDLHTRQSNDEKLPLKFITSTSTMQCKKIYEKKS